MGKQLSLKCGSMVIVQNREVNSSRQTWHIRAIVDKKQVIYRTWSGGGWKHYIVPIDALQRLYDDGNLKNGGKSRAMSPIKKVRNKRKRK